jgi:glutaminyl-tRNA synthetase
MLYDHLFTLENVDDIPEGKTYNDYLNPESAIKLEGCMIEPALDEAEAGDRFQFVRNGYYVKDTKNANTFNRIVGLKDSFPKK